MIKERIVLKSVGYAFGLMPWHFFIMLIIGLIMSAVPVAGIMLSRAIFTYAGNAMYEHIDIGSFTLILLAYALYFVIIKLYAVYYKRVAVQFNALPIFEKRVKLKFHEKADKIPLLNYESPQFYNSVWDAKVASINLYRIMECAIDFFIITLSIAVMGVFLSAFHNLFWIFIALSAVPAFLENIVEVKIRTKEIKELNKLSKETHAWYKCLIDPHYFKETVSYGSYGFLSGKLSRAFQDLLKKEHKVEQFILLAKSLSGLLKTLSVIGIYFTSVLLFYRGKIGFGEFMASIGAAMYLSSQYTSLFETSGYFSKFIQMVKPFFNFIETEQKQHSTEPFESIELENMNFKYPSSTENVLSGINMKIQSGEKVAIIGMNGMGKSTLVKIIMGHLPPCGGEVILNGNEVDWENYEFDILKLTATFQDFCRYELTVAENVAISDTSQTINESRVKSVLNAVGLNLGEMSLNSHLGREFGKVDFSGGQWQRLAIARCLYKNESKVFVFDEPTSAIDPLEEKALNEIFADKAKETVIVISHRLSIARLVDRIFVLDAGKIIEQGTHDELVLQNGYYSKMWSAQSAWYE